MFGRRDRGQDFACEVCRVWKGSDLVRQLGVPVAENRAWQSLEFGGNPAVRRLRAHEFRRGGSDMSTACEPGEVVEVAWRVPVVPRDAFHGDERVGSRNRQSHGLVEIRVPQGGLGVRELPWVRRDAASDLHSYAECFGRDEIRRPRVVRARRRLERGAGELSAQCPRNGVCKIFEELLWIRVQEIDVLGDSRAIEDRAAQGRAAIERDVASREKRDRGEEVRHEVIVADLSGGNTESIRPRLEFAGFDHCGDVCVERRA